MWMQEILVGLQECKSGGQDCVSEVALLLQEDDIELMEAATILHYVGMFINHKAYHRHSHYLIKVLFSFLHLFQVFSQPTMSTHDILLTHPFFCVSYGVCCGSMLVGMPRFHSFALFSRVWGG